MKKLPLKISGKVIGGKRYGRKIGFPTANLNTKPFDISNGIYAGWTTLDNEKYPAAIMVDHSPSFEVHILDFDKQIYGKIIEVEIVEKIRPYQKFNSEEKLISQIKKDIEEIRMTLSL